MIELVGRNSRCCKFHIILAIAGTTNHLCMTNELSLHLTAGPVSGQNLSGWHCLNDILARNLIECKYVRFVNCKVSTTKED